MLTSTPRRFAKAISAALRAISLTVWSFTCVATIAQTKPLNDTGITFCGGASSGNNSPCLAGDPVGQDRNYGRDAAALSKVGGSGGSNGFDFTKIANNGSELLAGATLGANAADWACTRDNVSGLIWEIKSASGLRALAHKYSWYKTGSLDGYNGTASSGASCEVIGRCDTEKYVEDVNNLPVALCGYRDWRMPTIKELEGIADLGRANPAIDPIYFPNTPTSLVWAATVPPNFLAWSVQFSDGQSNSSFSRDTANSVRVVRGVQ